MPLSATASRFACLPDDEAADSKVLKKLDKQKKEENKKNENNKQKDPSKTKAKNEAKELQNIAFGGGSGKKKNKKKNNQNKQQNNNGNNVESSQLEEWKERDKALVEDNFTADMQEAILQSQLEFEQQQSLVAAQQEMLSSGLGSEEVLASLSKEERKKVVKQQKKPTTMSLDQFNNAQDQSTEQNGVEASKPEPQLYRHPRHKERAGNTVRDSPEKDVKNNNKGADFFNQLDAATVMALDREQLLESYRKQDLSSLSGTSPGHVAGYHDRVASTEKQLLEAKLEIDSLNNKLNEAKLRTKKLTEILLSGEMKEKTEVLVQVHKLEKVREELSSSLAVTNAQLEQERSLVRMVENEVKKVGATAKGVELELCNRLMTILKTNRK